MSFVTSPPRGVTTLLLLLLTNLGVMSLGIGVLGEYIAKIYAECKRRPLWLVDYSLNLSEGQVPQGLTVPDVVPALSQNVVRDRRGVSGYTLPVRW